MAQDGFVPVLTRRGFLGGVAASAAAAILAACGGSAATDTPKPAATTAGSAPAATSAAPTVAATRPAVTAASTATSGTAASAGGAPAPAASVARGTASGTAAASGPVPTIPLPAADKFKGQKLAMLSNMEYFAETQKTIDAELQTLAKQLGVEITNDHVNDNTGDVVAKQDAAVKSGNTVDMAYFGKFVSPWYQLGDIVDVSDVVEELQKAYGPVEDGAKNDLFIDGKWRGIPFYTKANCWFARKDWMDEKGIRAENLKTFADLRDAALAVSDPAKNRFGWGNPISKGGDGNDLIVAVLRAYGAAVASDDGKKVVFNSPETLAAVTFLADIYTNPKYKDMIPPGVHSWTDTGNNEAWLAGTIGFTQNAFTLYAKSYADKNPVYGKTTLIPGFLGPGTDRVVNFGGWGAFMIFKGAKNPELAKEVAKHMVAGQPFLNIAKTSLGLILPAYKNLWGADPFYTQGEPNFPTLRTIIEADFPIRTKTGFNFPQTPSAGYDAVYNNYILTDMMGDIVLRGTKPADAIKTATDRMVKEFEQLGLKQQ